MTVNPTLKIKVQIYRGDDIAMGPGKADLLEAIEKTGSISAAGRDLGISYRRCWMLVDVMNRCWREQLVASSAGGRSGGGAHVTKTGKTVLAHYRHLQQCAESASGSDDWRNLEALLQP